MGDISDRDIRDFVERNIDMIVACAERGFTGAGAGALLIYLTDEGSIPNDLHAGYSSASALRAGGQIELAEAAETAKYPEEALMVLLLPNLEIVDFFKFNVLEAQREVGNPKKAVTFYRRYHLN